MGRLFLICVIVFFSFRTTRRGTDRHLQKNSWAHWAVLHNHLMWLWNHPKKKKKTDPMLLFPQSDFGIRRKNTYGQSPKKSIFLIMWFFHPLFGDLNVVTPNVVWRTSSSHQTRTRPSAEELQQSRAVSQEAAEAFCLHLHLLSRLKPRCHPASSRAPYSPVPACVGGPRDGRT